MDHHVILAVAGSGKTTHLVDSIDPTKANLILTYTENNHRNLRDKISRRFGHIPNGTRIYTYFSFLYSFFLRPLYGNKCGLKGINFDIPPESTRLIKRDQLRHYIDPHGRIYSARMAGFLINFKLLRLAKERIAKYFDRLYVDEVQDFAGYDFNLLTEISVANIESFFVGDFFQHTYDTSRDGAINRGLHDDFLSYKRRLGKLGFHIDETTLSASHRCSSTTCSFVSNSLGIPIGSHNEKETILEFVECETRSDALFNRSDIVKLFYQSHSLYRCFSDNWGASKGVDSYDSVCVVLNQTTEKLFKSSKLSELSPITKNKFYVACTRARSQLIFVPERLLKKYKGSS